MIYPTLPTPALLQVSVRSALQRLSAAKLSEGRTAPTFGAGDDDADHLSSSDELSRADGALQAWTAGLVKATMPFGSTSSSSGIAGGVDGQRGGAITAPTSMLPHHRLFSSDGRLSLPGSLHRWAYHHEVMRVVWPQILQRAA